MYSFDTAQEHELQWQKEYIESELPEVYKDWEIRKKAHSPETKLRSWFKEGADKFKRHMRDKRAMEIGCGSIPHLRESWGVERVVIDPLADEYRRYQEELFGGSFFEGMSIISKPAEFLITGFINNIDGVIICRNTLDHAEDPLTILVNISLYARSGCYFLFWSDLWHKEEPDDGHKNITRSPGAITALLSGLGFYLLHEIDSQHSGDRYIEYGGIFRKR